jgi:hypothetical protein
VSVLVCLIIIALTFPHVDASSDITDAPMPDAPGENNQPTAAGATASASTDTSPAQSVMAGQPPAPGSKFWNLAIQLAHTNPEEIDYRHSMVETMKSHVANLKNKIITEIIPAICQQHGSMVYQQLNADIAKSFVDSLHHSLNSKIQNTFEQYIKQHKLEAYVENDTAVHDSEQYLIRFETDFMMELPSLLMPLDSWDIVDRSLIATVPCAYPGPSLPGQADILVEYGGRVKALHSSVLRQKSVYFENALKGPFLVSK